MDASSFTSYTPETTEHDMPVKNKLSPFTYDSMDQTEIINANSQGNCNAPKKKTRKPERKNLKMTKHWLEIARKVSTLTGNDGTKKKLMKILSVTFQSLTITEKIQNLFIDSKFEFYGVQLKSEKPRKILIKGVPKGTSIKEIKNELVQSGYSIHSVGQLKNFKTRVNFIINIFPSRDFDSNFNIKNFLRLLVSVEIYNLIV